VILESQYGSPKLLTTVSPSPGKVIEDPVENIGSIACGRRRSGTNDDAGDGTTTATILSAALIAEGMKIVAAGANPVRCDPKLLTSPRRKCSQIR
jgi:chaperonin GroEL